MPDRHFRRAGAGRNKGIIVNRQDARDARKNMEKNKNPKMEPGERLDAWARRTLAAAVEVHKHLGPGYPESVYEEALTIELLLQKIPFERQLAFRFSTRLI
jgi:hypothetical protein